MSKPEVIWLVNCALTALSLFVNLLTLRRIRSIERVRWERSL